MATDEVDLEELNDGFLKAYLKRISVLAKDEQVSALRELQEAIDVHAGMLDSTR